MATNTTAFTHVRYSWDDAVADKLDPVDRLVYKACYELTLELIERAGRYMAAHDKGAQTFGGQRYQSLDEARRHAVFAAILPWLRGQVSQLKRPITPADQAEAIFLLLTQRVR